MPAQTRHRLSRDEIDTKAEEVLLHFDSQVFNRLRSSIYDVVAGLQKDFGIPFHFDQELGRSAKGNKILGLFQFQPRRILLDRILPHDSPRFRWTLAHEIGHFVLHRKLDPTLISRDSPQLVDTRAELRFLRTARRSELDWIEWQANQFASAILLPRPILLAAVIGIQRKLNTRRLGSIYLDDQTCNLRDYISILRHVSHELNVSRTVLRIRLLNLGILTDARRSSRDHVQETLRALFSEENSTSSSEPLQTSVAA